MSVGSVVDLEPHVTLVTEKTVHIVKMVLLTALVSAMELVYLTVAMYALEMAPYVVAMMTMTMTMTNRRTVTNGIAKVFAVALQLWIVAMYVGVMVNHVLSPTVRMIVLAVMVNVAALLNTTTVEFATEMVSHVCIHIVDLIAKQIATGYVMAVLLKMHVGCVEVVPKHAVDVWYRLHVIMMNQLRYRPSRQ
jgi:hypothetical protein